jgi:hypothetical protein
MTGEAVLFETMLYIFMSVVFSLGALVFFIRLYFSMDSGDDLRIDYHWGGLGGGIGGWRISKPLGYLFAALAFAGLLVVTTVQMRALNASQTPPQKPAEQKTAEAGPDSKAAEQKPLVPSTSVKP